MSYERIKPGMAGGDILLAIAGSNPGPITALSSFLRNVQDMDPVKESKRGLACLWALDQLRIYEDRFYVLYRDVCGWDSRKLFALLCLCELDGFSGFTSKTVNDAIDSDGQIDFDEAMTQARELVPDVNWDAVSAESTSFPQRLRSRLRRLVGMEA